MDGYGSLVAIVAALIVGASWRYEARRRAERAAGAPANAWERPATFAGLTMSPGAWVIFGLLGLDHVHADNLGAGAVAAQRVQLALGQTRSRPEAEHDVLGGQGGEAPHELRAEVQGHLVERTRAIDARVDGFAVKAHEHPVDGCQLAGDVERARERHQNRVPWRAQPGTGVGSASGAGGDERRTGEGLSSGAAQYG